MSKDRLIHISEVIERLCHAKWKDGAGQRLRSAESTAAYKELWREVVEMDRAAGNPQYRRDAA